MPYTPGGFPYDGSTLLEAKEDGDEISAEEVNTLISKLANAGNAQIAGDYIGLRDMTEGMPDAAPSGEVRFASDGGIPQVSFDGVDWQPLLVGGYGTDISGTPGNATVNQLAGRAAIASGQTAVTVTNSY